MTGSRGTRRLIAAVGIALILTGCATPAGVSALGDHETITATPRGGDVSPTVDPKPETTVVDDASGPDAPSSAVASPTAAPDAEPDFSPEDGDPTTALEALALLEVRPRDPKSGYDRDAFGYRDVDFDRNGCDARNDVLGRDLVDVVFKPDTRDCVVESGVLFDPFTGDAIVFERGDSSNLVQIDHVVPLSDAWQKGAQHLDQGALHGIGNDPLNLLAVYAKANSQKGDGDAATWLPSNKAFRCEYVARQVAVKYAYGLWVVQPEKEAIERILGGCPDQPLPVGATSPEVPTPKETIAPKPPEAKPDPSPTPPPEDVYYKNCTEAREAGVTPILRGEPGYGKHLDRDGDGVACE